MVGHLALDAIPSRWVDDRSLQSFVNLLLVAEPSSIDRVREDLVEMPPTDEAASCALALPVGPKREADVLLVEDRLEANDTVMILSHGRVI